MDEQLYSELLDIYVKKIGTNPAVLKYSKYTKIGIKHLVEKILDSKVVGIKYILDKDALIKVRRYIVSASSGKKSNTYRALLERLTSRSQIVYYKKQVKKSGPIDLETPASEFLLTNITYTSTMMSLIGEKTLRDIQLADLVEFAYNPEYLELYRIGPTIQGEVKDLVEACGHTRMVKIKK